MSAPSALLREDTELLPDAYDILAKKFNVTDVCSLSFFSSLFANFSQNKPSTWLGKRKKEDGNERPATPPQAKAQKEPDQSPLSRRRTETQAQEFDEDEDDNHALGPHTPSPPSGGKEHEKKEEKEEDNDETRDEDEDEVEVEVEDDQMHDSIAPIQQVIYPPTQASDLRTFYPPFKSLNYEIIDC